MAGKRQWGFLFVGAFCLIGCASTAPGPQDAADKTAGCVESRWEGVKEGDRICYEFSCFRVEVAETQEECRKGLQGRKALDKDSGMLFVFPESGQHSFWMKNTLIPLDIIWLDDHLRVVHVAARAEPCPKRGPCPEFTPEKDALYVLELNAGAAEHMSLQVGDSMSVASK